MVEIIKKFGWVKSVLTLIIMLLGIATSMWALSANISSSVSEKVEDTAREVIKEELTTYSDDLANIRAREIDAKIEVHELQSEIKLNEKLSELKDQNMIIQGQLSELIRRSQ